VDLKAIVGESGVVGTPIGGEGTVSCKFSGRLIQLVTCDHDFALPSKVSRLASTHRTAVRGTGDSNCYLICCRIALPAQQRPSTMTEATPAF
jgi:hypothetical protein